MQNLVVIGTVKFLHDLFTAVWIGGMIIMALVILPVVKKKIGPGPEGKHLIELMKPRLSKLTYVSIIGLFVTGILLSNSSPLFDGFLSISNQYSVILSIKHILIASMVLIALFRSQGIPRMKTIQGPKEQKLSGGLLMFNVILGVCVLLLSGLLAAQSIVT
jgi:putative copper export protein